jgi:hypothetical protein
MRNIDTKEITKRLLAEKWTKHPHSVEQYGLVRLELGEERFRFEIDERLQWIDENCISSFSFDTLRDETKVYLFADADESFHFKLRFGSRVFPRTEDH